MTIDTKLAPWTTIDEGDRLGIVLPTDRGTKIVYLPRNIQKRVREILDRHRNLSENPS